MSDFDIDKFDDYLVEAQTSADATRPEPPAATTVVVEEPVTTTVVVEEPKGPDYEMVANKPGKQGTQYNNEVPEDFEARFRYDVGAAIKTALKERMSRARQIRLLQQKLGFER